MRMRRLRLDLWLPPLLLMGVIFFFSAQPSLDSGLGLIDLIGRKLVHFAEYALLCFLWWRALVTVTTPGRAALLAFLLASGYAVTDEFHQTFVEGRHGTPGRLGDRHRRRRPRLRCGCDGARPDRLAA